MIPPFSLPIVELFLFILNSQILKFLNSSISVASCHSASWSCVFLRISFSICVVTLPLTHVVFCSRAQQMVDLVVALDTARSGEVLCFVFTMVIKTELWTRVHCPVVRAADWRSAAPQFNSGRRSIHTHWHIQRNNMMSPNHNYNHNANTTIPRKVS